ncbi:hypothetical protein HDE_06576 [Halotydeus destructor]|nr:hypothetical protein HDE_06576 [Halotydeus destructor]
MCQLWCKLLFILVQLMVLIRPGRQLEDGFTDGDYLLLSDRREIKLDFTKLDTLSRTVQRSLAGDIRSLDYFYHGNHLMVIWLESTVNQSRMYVGHFNLSLETLVNVNQLETNVDLANATELTVDKYQRSPVMYVSSLNRIIGMRLEEEENNLWSAKQISIIEKRTNPVKLKVVSTKEDETPFLAWIEEKCIYKKDLNYGIEKIWCLNGRLFDDDNGLNLAAFAFEEYFCYLLVSNGEVYRHRIGHNLVDNGDNLPKMVVSKDDYNKAAHGNGYAERRPSAFAVHSDKLNGFQQINLFVGDNLHHMIYHLKINVTTGHGSEDRFSVSPLSTLVTIERRLVDFVILHGRRQFEFTNWNKTINVTESPTVHELATQSTHDLPPKKFSPVNVSLPINENTVEKKNGVTDSAFISATSQLSNHVWNSVNRTVQLETQNGDEGQLEDGQRLPFFSASAIENSVTGDGRPEETSLTSTSHMQMKNLSQGLHHVSSIDQIERVYHDWFLYLFFGGLSLLVVMLLVLIVAKTVRRSHRLDKGPSLIESQADYDVIGNDDTMDKGQRRDDDYVEIVVKPRDGDSGRREGSRPRSRSKVRSFSGRQMLIAAKQQLKLDTEAALCGPSAPAAIGRHGTVCIEDLGGFANPACDEDPNDPSVARAHSVWSSGGPSLSKTGAKKRRAACDVCDYKDECVEKGVCLSTFSLLSK